MVPRPGGSGLLISILVSATVGRAQDLCIGGDPEPQGSLVCRRATMPPTMQIDSPRIPTPQTTPSGVSRGDATSQGPAPFPANHSSSPSPTPVDDPRDARFKA